jgi:hypothetical protein
LRIFLKNIVCATNFSWLKVMNVFSGGNVLAGKSARRKTPLSIAKLFKETKMQVTSRRHSRLFSQRAGTILLGSLLLVIASCLHTPEALAQYRASIQGVVTDPQGAVVAGATVTLTDKETNKVLTSTTAGSGTYNFNALPPSRFAMAVEKAGFKKRVLSDLQVIPEQANALNVQLEIGESTQTVTVSGNEIPAMDTETASISGTITANEIQHLPSFGRDVFQLAQLAPGVFGDGAQSGGGGTYSLPGTNQGGSSSSDGIFKTENGPQISANGSQTNSNGITIDGISTVSAVWGGASVITPSEDSVQTVKVVSNSYDAENGRFSGAQIQVTTKAGTNTVHGSLFFEAVRPGLNAYQRWNGATSLNPGTPAQRGLLRDSQRFNQFGGSIGGPLWKNKLFGFFNYETLRNNTSTTGTSWYETPQLLKYPTPTGSIASHYLNFAGEPASISAIISATCATAGLAEGVNCRTIPGQGLDIGSPLKTPRGTHDPTFVNSNAPGVGGGLDGIPDITLASTLSPNNVQEAQYNGRIDANVTRRDLVAFTIYWSPSNTSGYNGPARAANFRNKNIINDAFTILWNHTFSPTLLNEARANAAGWRWNMVAANPHQAFGLPVANFGVPGTPSYGSISVQSLGTPGPSIFNQWTYGYQDILTKVAGRHNLKAGGQVTHLEYLNENVSGARPSYSFVNHWDFLNDAPYSETGTFNPLNGIVTANRQDDRLNLFGIFVQDDFKLRSNLTVNLGLRYSYFGPMYSKQNNLSVIEFGSGSNYLTGLSARTGGNLFQAQKGNFGPQFGFAWSPAANAGKFVVRGGFGLNFNQEEIAIAANGNSNPPNVVNVTICCSTFAQPNTNIVYGVPSDPTSLFGYPANPNVISPYNAANLPINGAPISVVGFPASVPTQYTYHYSLDTQYDLGHQWVATLGYQGSNSRHLILQTNQNVVAASQGIALNPRTQTVGYYGNGGNANYNALLTGLKHQFSHSFLADAEYTWAKSMDNGSQPYYQDPYPYNPRFSYGRSDYNVGNVFKTYVLWRPTIFHGSNNWVEKIAGGWSFSGIFNLHTGFPWTPTYSVSNLYYQGSGFSTLRPAAYLGGAGNDTSNDAFKSGPNPLDNNAANKNFPLGGAAYFTAPASNVPKKVPAFPATYGPPQDPGVARNSFNGPNYRDVDATIVKAFGLPNNRILGEDAHIEFRADAFNLFNNLNINGGSITTLVTSPTFGQAKSALGSRTIALQAHFTF